IHEKLVRLDRRVENPMDVLCRIEPNMGGDDAQEQVLARPYCFHADTFALQVADAADALVREQFVAADHHPTEHRDRLTGADRVDYPCGSVQGEVDLAARDRLTDDGRRHIHILYIGKTLPTQQLSRYKLRGNADRWAFVKADLGRLEAALRGQRRWRADK